MPFNPVDLIVAKRDGKSLSATAIQLLVDAYTQGTLPDYQMSAFLMAAYLNGLDDQETTALTEVMLHSGDVVDLSDISGIKVDKHSTGGVGDKVSLLLAPIVAACGVSVPMISGRGLGHSGGTLDKLESIPGFRVDLSIAEYKAQLERIGVVMIGQTAEIAPADRKIYALRDVTATIDNISFIAPSIMSKKIAAGIDALVLDVKCGRGAFMRSPEKARKLAEKLVAIGEQFGKPTVAWMTAMDQPLGYAVGNWPEVAESIRCLKGEWIDDLMLVTLTLAGEMLHLGNVAENPREGYKIAKKSVDDGKAFARLIQMVEAQGGATKVIADPEEYVAPAFNLPVYAGASSEGYTASIDALEIGKIAVDLGAGRIRKEDDVDPSAGLLLDKKVGDYVHPGELLATLYSSSPIDEAAFDARMQAAYSYVEEKPALPAVLLGRYTRDGWE